MQQRFWQQWHIHVGTGGFLILSHLFAGAVAVAVGTQAEAFNTAPWVFAVLALVAAGATGWLLTIELRRNLHLAELALQRLKDGLPIA